ncbi:MAG: DUF432 domain-containing protein [Spirochaetales bacterium]|nr:DUF432 domain-containing protein [Spirochaetales bacterium]
MKHSSIPWGQLNPGEETLVIELPFEQSLHIQKKDEELNITKTVLQDSETHRFITGKSNHAYLYPSLPDLPITIKPQQATTILPGKKMEVFIEVPLSVSLYYGSHTKKELIYETPLHPLSRSFFGSPDNGELSYFLESPLYCKYEIYENSSSSVYCPVSITNKSVQKLDIERMILRVPLLSIYESGAYLVSSPVTISFRGQDDISQINYLNYSNDRKQNMTLLASPRQKVDKSLLKRSFYFLKTLYTG